MDTANTETADEDAGTDDAAPVTTTAPVAPTAPLERAVSERTAARRARRTAKRNRKAFAAAMMPTAPPARTAAELTRVQSPFRPAPKRPTWTRLLGQKDDGRSRLLHLAGYYDLTRSGMTTSTRQAEVLTPLTSEPSLGHRGTLVGTEGGSDGLHIFDGHEMYGENLHNGNVIILGDPGSGKSSLLKTSFVLRPLRIGRKVAVIDSKPQMRRDETTGEEVYTGWGEYSLLAQTLGYEVIRIDRSGSTRINPLDPRFGRDRKTGTGEDESSYVGSDTLLRTLLTIALGRELTGTDHYAVTVAHKRAGERARAERRAPVLSDLFHALNNPAAEDAAAFHEDEATLRKWGQPVALAVDRLISGDLNGIADGPTSEHIDFDSQLMVFDLSALDGETDVLPMVMALVGTLLRNVWITPGPNKYVLVVDEGWHVIGSPSTARMFRRLWKFSRSLGLVNVAAMHRLSDLPSTDDPASPARALLDEAATRIAYHLDNDNADAVGRVFDFPPAAVEMIPQLGRGRAIWHIGNTYPRLVAHSRSSIEMRLTATDEAMTGSAV